MTDAAEAPLLSVRDVSKSFGALKAVDGVSLDVPANRIVGMIGPNGSGKSTLFNVVSGFYPADAGRVWFQGKRIDGLTPDVTARMGLCRTFQVSRAPERLTVLDNLLLAARHQRGEAPLEALFRRPAMRASEQQNLERARQLLKLLRLTRLKDEYASNLSGGQKKLLALGRALMREADLILLDEPTAGVNPTLVDDLLAAVERARQEEGRSFLIIEHSMKVIRNVCEKVFVFNFGRNLAEGTPEEIHRNEAVLEAYLSAQ
jgi:branched-chain amino acid transport system ATP-binding protein/neutral amino acid transport system ATP-binding protein